jgi:hypothetical protein
LSFRAEARNLSQPEDSQRTLTEPLPEAHILWAFVRPGL